MQIYVELEPWVMSTKADLTADVTDETFGFDLTRNMRRDIEPGFTWNLYRFDIHLRLPDLHSMHSF